ncbi:MAG: hypothetical protein HY898_05655 [Deltaproteobacteria bacterium]|nr:hypothetical protein [Deltaproteobacteria bacterium]
MQRTRSGGQRGDHDMPSPFWHRSWMAVSVSLCVGAVGAAIGTASTGGCSAMESEDAAAGGPSPSASCPGSPSIEPCLAKNCCNQYTSCSRDTQCAACFGKDAGECSDNALFQALLSCELQYCGQGFADTGPTSPEAGEGPGDASMLLREELTLAIVHASANLWPFRVCFKQVDTGEFVDIAPLPSDPAAVMPHSNTVGVAPGSALLLRNAENVLGQGAVRLVPYLLRVDRLAGKDDKTCSQLVCTDSWCLLPEDYVSLPEVSINATAMEAAAVLVVHGCLESAGGATPERCGGDVKTEGKLAIRTFDPYPLGVDAPAQGYVRVRAAHFSESADSVLLGNGGDAGQSGKLRLLYGSFANPGTGQTLLDGDPFLTLRASDVPIAVPGVQDKDLIEYEKNGFTLLSPMEDGGVAHPLTLSLAVVQDLSDSTGLPHTFWNKGTDYLVALVGDATKGAAQLHDPDGGTNPYFDGVGLHLIALPMRVLPQLDASAGP